MNVSHVKLYANLDARDSYQWRLVSASGSTSQGNKALKRLCPSSMSAIHFYNSVGDQLQSYKLFI